MPSLTSSVTSAPWLRARAATLIAVRSDDFGGAAEEEQWGHARIVAKDRRNERILRVGLAHVGPHA